jgi:hypothetical protein
LGTAVELRLYPSFSCITAVAMFATGSGLWGGCYAFGVCFLALAFVMVFDLRWAPLEFGLLWAVTLVVIAERLRRIAAATGARPDGSSGGPTPPVGSAAPAGRTASCA